MPNGSKTLRLLWIRLKESPFLRMKLDAKRKALPMSPREGQGTDKEADTPKNKHGQGKEQLLFVHGASFAIRQKNNDSL